MPPSTDAQVCVHLLHPPPYGEVPFKHLGLAYVGAGLRAWGYDTRLHDVSERLHRQGRDFYSDLILRLSSRAGNMSDLPFIDLMEEVLFPEHRDSSLATTIREQCDEAMNEVEGARVVGMSINPLTTYAAAYLGRRLREQGVGVLLGGPHASAPALSHLLLHLGTADALLAGDGDLACGPLVDALIEGRFPVDVPGALWLDGEQVRTNPPGPSPKLSELPRPLLDGYVLDQFLPLQASRGCPRLCRYCSEQGIWQGSSDSAGSGPGERHRRRSPSEVVDEMRWLHQTYGLSDFHFHDDMLNNNRHWLEEFVDGVGDLGFTWESFFEPYGLSPELIEKMAGAGCRLVKYGVQSFSPAQLKRMGRPASIDRVTEVITKTYQTGISTHYDMLIGFPGETEEDHAINLREVEALYQATGERLYFSLNPYYLSAGSAVSARPQDFGVRLSFADPSSCCPELAQALERSPPYPMGYESHPSREIITRRMKELAQILEDHGKDYLYLGQDALPDGEDGPRVMLPPGPEPKENGVGLNNGEMEGRDIVFLHVPRWSEQRREIMVMPMGVPAMARMLEDEGRRTAIVHLGLEKEHEGFSLRDLLRRANPRLVLLSLHWHPQTRHVINTAHLVHKWLPEATVVLGGLSASHFARELLEMPFIHGVVWGDGEEPLRSLARVVLDGRGSLGDVPNLMWRDGEGKTHQNDRSWVLDAGSAAHLHHGTLSQLLHAPDYLRRALYADFSEGAQGSDGYAGAAYLNGGRGCKAQCINCGGARESQLQTTGREGVLHYPLVKLMRDVHEALGEGATTLRMSFDPAGSRQHLQSWFQAMESDGVAPRLVYDFWHLPTAGFLESMARTFAQGSTLVWSPECGAESVRARIRGMHFSNENLLKSLRLAQDLGFNTHCFFSAGLPTETPQNIEESAKLIERVLTDTASAVSVCPMVLDPASPIFLRPKDFGVRLVRQTLRDFYEEVGLEGGPGYETETLDEEGILKACDRLLKTAGLAPLSH